MITGMVGIEFLLHDCQTLKDKRSIVKRIIDRTKNRFNISIAEIDCLDLCQRGIIGIAAVSNNKRHVNSMIDKVINFIEKLNLVDIIMVETNFY